jgi:DNA-binding CsgD family transcriptional regulator
LVRYREQGHETSCYEILAHLAEVEYRAGRFERAMSHVVEAVDIALEATIDVLGELLPVRAAVACSLGDLEAAASDAEEGLAICERTADRWNEIRCRSVLGSVEISRDDHVGANAWLDPLPELTAAMDLREPGAFPFVPDAVEALLGLGELDRAEELAGRLDRQGQELGRLLALGTAARCHGLVMAARGDLAEAADLLARSEHTLRSVPQPFELARTLLVGGEIQRRMKKKTSARELLGDSIALFEEMGAALWARKARRAQARIGGRPPSPSALTPSEEEIALRVADGRTNREIAAALFMSVNTVESNLKRIYRKLGVRSRVELTNWVGERSSSVKRTDSGDS